MKDCIGQEVQIGDYVTYSTKHADSIRPMVGQVLQFVESKDWRGISINKVQLDKPIQADIIGNQFISPWGKNSKKTTVEMKRVIKIDADAAIAYMKAAEEAIEEENKKREQRMQGLSVDD